MQSIYVQTIIHQLKTQNNINIRILLSIGIDITAREAP